jgi:hypothetical protein
MKEIRQSGQRNERQQRRAFHERIKNRHAFRSTASESDPIIFRR